MKRNYPSPQATDEAAGRSVRKQPAPLVAADRLHVDASLAGKTRKELTE